MKEELKKLKKSGKLKEFAKAAGAGGIKNSISQEAKDKISSTIGNISSSLSKMKKKTSLGDRDAQLETQTAKRYEKVGVSPIYSKGNFSRNTKEIDEKLGNRLTEDDKVASKSKKKNKSQY